jgi:hypothetical protein
MSNTALTRAQTKALDRIEKRLKKSFKRSLRRIRKTGAARTWAYPFLKILLREYRRARKKIVDRASLTSIVGAHKHDFFAVMLQRPTDREGKARSRWSRTMKNAAKSKIRPSDLEAWPKKGGGISGRAK